MFGGACVGAGQRSLIADCQNDYSSTILFDVRKFQRDALTSRWLCSKGVSVPLQNALRSLSFSMFCLCFALIFPALTKGSFDIKYFEAKKEASPAAQLPPTKLTYIWAYNFALASIIVCFLFTAIWIFSLRPIEKAMRKSIIINRRMSNGWGEKKGRRKP